MAREGLENENPTLHSVLGSRDASDADWDDSITDPFDVREIFDLIRDINDPEHPLTLEQLNVVTEEQIMVDDSRSKVEVEFTPTIPHCSMATLIGLAIRVKLLRSQPDRFKVDLRWIQEARAAEQFRAENDRKVFLSVFCTFLVMIFLEGEREECNEGADTNCSQLPVWRGQKSARRG